MDREPSLAEAVRELVLAAERFRSACGRRHGLNPTSVTALAHLHLSESVTAGQLARHLGIGPAAATELIDKLESLGAVTRTRQPTDRRKLVVELTDLGRWMIDDVYGQFTQRVDHAAAAFGMQGQVDIAAFAAIARDELLRLDAPGPAVGEHSDPT